MAWHYHGRHHSHQASSLLTSFPGSRTLVPGISFASQLPPSAYQNIYSAPKYDISKTIGEDPNIKDVKLDQESIRVSNKPKPTLQLGFGVVPDPEFEKIDENEIEEENSSQSSEKVDSNIVKAFEHPVFTVKKDVFISGKGKKLNSTPINYGVKKVPKLRLLKIVQKKV
jgi:hypothetical protein